MEGMNSLYIKRVGGQVPRKVRVGNEYLKFYVHECVTKLYVGCQLTTTLFFFLKLRTRCLKDKILNIVQSVIPTLILILIGHS